jgi:hypothetical protein
VAAAPARAVVKRQRRAVVVPVSGESVASAK